MKENLGKNISRFCKDIERITQKTSEVQISDVFCVIFVDNLHFAFVDKYSGLIYSPQAIEKGEGSSGNLFGVFKGLESLSLDGSRVRMPGEFSYIKLLNRKKP
jgi:hypothetical protein